MIKKNCKEIIDQLEFMEDLKENPICCTECGRSQNLQEGKICWSCKDYIENWENIINDWLDDDDDFDLEQLDISDPISDSEYDQPVDDCDGLFPDTIDLLD